MSIIRSFQQIVSRFMPAGIAPASPESLKIQTIVSVSLLVGMSGFPFMVLFFLMGHTNEAFVVLWSWAFFMGIPFLARKSATPNILGHLLAANYYQCHLLLCLLWGGIDAPNVMWFIAMPIVSVLVGGISHGVVWSIVAAVSVFGVYAVELFGLVEWSTSLDPAENRFIVASGSVGLLAALLGSTAAFEIFRASAFKRRLAAEEELRQANSELKELDVQKTSFFQNVSHELRTPLTLILPPLDDAVRDRPQDGQMAMAARNARRLLRLVNQLLDLQKLSAGKRTLNTEPIELLGFLRICTDAFRSACSTKEINFELLINETPPTDTTKAIWITAELDALEKIVFNFLSNALKFTPHGGAIELAATAEGQGPVRISIKDTGEGIAEQDLPRLFKEFSQVDSTATRAFEGTGLGLALARSLAIQLGGDVGVQSTVGVGSVFWVELPLAQAPATAESPSFSPREWLIDNAGVSSDTQPTVNLEAPEGEGALALVVDDLSDLRGLVSNFLERAGYRTVQASNGQQALALVESLKPDIVVTDWMMPVMTGVELIEAMRKRPDVSGIPVVLLTAKTDEESRLTGTELGADAFVGKPFSEQELVSIVRNLVALKARERELERSYKRVEALLVQVEAANEAKSRFLAQISHELRTPLNGILGTSEALQGGVYGAVTKEQGHALTTLDTAANHQLSLVNDLLDLAKIEQGGFEPMMEAVSVPEIAGDVLELLGHQATQGGLELNCNAGNDPLYAVTDGRRVRQMLLNLVGNAIKFTPQGGTVTLTISGSDGRIVLAVTDTGIGIDPQELPRMFEAFTQVDSTLQRQHNGTGLGLNLTAKLAQLLGGELTAESQLGSGSTFTVSLPYNAPTPEEIAALEKRQAHQRTALSKVRQATVAPSRDLDEATLGALAPSPVVAAQNNGESDSHGLHVLLVDDTPANIGHVRDYLVQKGHRVTTAANGLEAIEKAQFRPDIIFMDVQMPGMDGIEAIKRLRADSHTQDLHIVSLTSLTEQDDRELSLSAGANAYETKPVSLKRILGIVQSRQSE